MGALAQAQLGSGRLARNHKNPVTAVSKPDLRAEARKGRVKVATEEAQPLQPRRGLVIQGRGEFDDLRCDCIGSVEFSGTYGCRARGSEKSSAGRVGPDNPPRVLAPQPSWASAGRERRKPRVPQIRELKRWAVHCAVATSQRLSAQAPAYELQRHL
ncbi:MAG: hypothetical protein WBZ51_26145 [Xanthobacteraceae bacterium]